MVMYVERVPNRNSPPAVLLRRSYREGGKVRKETLANLSKWPDELVENFRILLQGGVAVPSLDDAFRIVRSRPHGHVAAVVGSARKLGFEQLLDRKPSRNRSLATAMVLARILDPDSQLATAQGLIRETLADTLAEELDVQDADADELGAALDWLLARQAGIERRLTRKHLADGSLALGDMTSAFRSCDHRLVGRARAHAFLRRLACYVEWHMRRALAPMLLDAHDPTVAEGGQPSPVAPAPAAPATGTKAGAPNAPPDGLPVHSFRTLLADLATLTRNRVQPAGAAPTDILALPTPVQDRAFRLLGVKP